MAKETKEMSIADYKIENVKVFYRWATLVSFIAGGVIGLVGSYFVAVQVVTSTQHDAIQVVKTIQAEQSKE